MTIYFGAGQDLRTYLGENGPLPPERAALLVASLAEQLAALHAEGLAYRNVRPEAVRVTGAGPAQGVSVTVTARTIPLTVQAASANVRDAGILLSGLLGGTSAGGRQEGAPAALWRVVESCVGADAGQRPQAALLAQLLRDAADPPPVVPVPRYVPYASAAPDPSHGWRSRWTGKALVVAVASVLVIAITVTGVLLHAAGGVHTPSANAGLVRQASRWTAPSSASAATDPPATVSPTDRPAGPSPTADPPAPQPPSGPVDATNVGTAPGPAGITPPPPPPPTGEPSPTPGTRYRTSAFDVPAGATRPPLVRGGLTWYNRSVGVSAVVSSTSPCASAVFTGYAGGKQVARIATAYRCGNITVSQNLDGRTIVGGITQVMVDLYVNGRLIGRDSCLRSTARCTRA